MDSLLAPNDVEDRYGGVPLGAEAFVVTDVTESRTSGNTPATASGHTPSTS